MNHTYLYNDAPIKDGQIIDEVRVTHVWLDGQDDERLSKLNITRRGIVEQQPRPSIDSRYQIASPMEDGSWMVTDRPIDPNLINGAIAIVVERAAVIRNEALGFDRTLDAVKQIKQGLALISYANLPETCRAWIEMEAAALEMTGEQLHGVWSDKSMQLTQAALGLDAITARETAAITAKAQEEGATAKDLFDSADAANFAEIETMLEQ